MWLLCICLSPSVEDADVTLRSVGAGVRGLNMLIYVALEKYGSFRSVCLEM